MRDHHQTDSARCDLCETRPATETRTEGGSLPVYRTCAECAARFDELTAPDPCPECNHDLDAHSLEGSEYHPDTPGPGCRTVRPYSGNYCICPVERGDPARLADAFEAVYAAYLVR